MNKPQRPRGPFTPHRNRSQRDAEGQHPSERHETRQRRSPDEPSHPPREGRRFRQELPAQAWRDERRSPSSAPRTRI